MSQDGPLQCGKCGVELPASTLHCPACGAVAQGEPTVALELDVDVVQPIRIGDLIAGRWRIEARVGAGSVGAVFQAKEVANDRKVAIKVLSRALCNDAGFAERFVREAKASARIDHPNVIGIYEVDRHAGRPFVAMKWVEGETLEARIRANPGGVRAAKRSEIGELVRGACAALACLRSSGLVHGDVKPGGIMVGTDGHVVLLDRGVPLEPHEFENITRLMQMRTPRYVAPEVAAGVADIRSDLYSLGVIVYEYICGSPPFDDPTQVAILRMHAEAPVPDIRTHAQYVPAPLVDFFAKALAKKPEDRFQHPDDFLVGFEAAWPEETWSTGRPKRRTDPLMEAVRPPTPAAAPPPAVEAPLELAPLIEMPPPTRDMAPTLPFAVGEGPDTPPPPKPAIRRLKPRLDDPSEARAKMTRRKIFLTLGVVGLIAATIGGVAIFDQVKVAWSRVAAVIPSADDAPAEPALDLPPVPAPAPEPAVATPTPTPTVAEPPAEPAAPEGAPLPRPRPMPRAKADAPLDSMAPPQLDLAPPDLVKKR